ncbi:MAG: flippase-like domain-containing protein [Chloroflexi bacterium]|nr:flippase-like domain-containing protein [Chloroflexota bacterium]
MPFWKTTWFRVTLGTLVSAVFLYLALRDVPLLEVAQALARANYGWVAIATVAMVLQSWLRTVRWIRLFYPLHKGLNLWRMFGIVLVAQMLNIVAPWRLGDLARVYLAGEMGQRSKAQTLATLGTEKIFDTLMMLVLLLGIPAFMTLPSNLEKPREGFIVLSAILFAAAAALIVLGDWLLGLLRRIPISAWRRFLDTHGALALGSLDVLKRWDMHLQLQALSVAIYSLGVIVNYLTLQALGLELPWIASFLLLAVLLVGGFVPSSPGKVGVFQYLCIATLALFGVDQSIGLAFGILLYLVAYGTPIVLGILVLWWGGVSLKSIRAAQAEPR